MTNKLTENDVRLIRRVLVALNFEDQKSAERITYYLRTLRKVNMVLPAEQTETQRQKYAKRLPANERWLIERFGCVLMPDYGECVFLNSKWANPRTLYVHLVKPVSSLGALGEIYWLPEVLGGNNKAATDYKAIAEINHAAYLEAQGV